MDLNERVCMHNVALSRRPDNSALFNNQKKNSVIISNDLETRHNVRKENVQTIFMALPIGSHSDNRSLCYRLVKSTISI
ncbi:hypothetical protein V1478_010518 [Vespula squamosa]|uniref:Uncharacterized protein n=1 Tax=Vespula squamosa TaxID=30214 RepID=A0ABD2AI01_VESSQ